MLTGSILVKVALIRLFWKKNALRSETVLYINPDIGLNEDNILHKFRVKENIYN